MLPPKDTMLSSYFGLRAHDRRPAEGGITRVVVFSAVVIATALLLQAGDTGVAAYVDNLFYEIREGNAVWHLVAAKLVFVAGLVLCLTAKNRYVRRCSYAVTFVSLWLATLNLLVNGSQLNTEVVRIAIGDVSTRAYVGDVMRLFATEILTSGAMALGISAAVLMMTSRLLVPVATWKAVLPIVVLCAGYFGIRGPGYLVGEMPAPIKVPGVVYAFLHRAPHVGPRDAVRLMPGGDSVQRLIFIVDESVRGDVLSVNGFGLPTTPFLNQAAAQHFNYGIAAAGTNSSGSANILLQTGIAPAEMPEAQDRILRTPNIFAHAKKAGYRTFYLPVRGEPGLYQDFMSSFDFASIDEAAYTKNANPGRPRVEADYLLAEQIVKIVKRYPNEKLFIYALKEGNHFLYRDAYPPSASAFPDRTGDELADLRNGYYNASRWVVDGFLERLLQDLDKVNSTIVYTSDHGQGLREEGDKSTHGKPYRPLAVQANVPLMVLATQADNARFRRLAEPAIRHNFNRASHANIFPTLLVLMGYDRQSVTRGHASSLFDPIPDQERIFLSGDLWGKHYANRFGPDQTGKAAAALLNPAPVVARR